MGLRSEVGEPPVIKNWVGSLGWEDIVERMAIHPVFFLPWRIPWTDELVLYPWRRGELDTTGLNYIFNFNIYTQIYIRLLIEC